MPNLPIVNIVTLDFRLQLLHGNNVGGLNVVLELLDLLLQLVKGDLVVFNDQVDLELLDTETNSDQLGGTPYEAVFLDRENIGLELIHVCLIVYMLLAFTRAVVRRATYPRA